MGSIIIFLLIGFLFILFLVLFIKYQLFKKYLLDNFRTNNTITCGGKRKGKDILFDWIIRKRKEPYYANIEYSYPKWIKCQLIDVSVAPNTYENLIHGDVVKTKHLFYEDVDIYFSDFGNYAPATYDSLLHKEYKSMPIFQSVNGHLYNSRFHINAQFEDQIWKPIRKQGEFFIRVIGTKKIFGFLFITYLRTYEKYEAFEKNLFPLKKLHFNKYNKADFARYYAENGLIKNGYIINFKWSLKYDHRAFEKIFLKGKRKIYKG